MEVCRAEIETISTNANSYEEIAFTVHQTVQKIIDIVTSYNIPVIHSPISVFKRYNVLDELGSGTYAKVYKLKEKKTGRISAGKCLRPDSFSTTTRNRVVQMFSNEIIFFHRTQCEGVVGLYNVIYSCDGILLDMEYVEGGTIWKDNVCPNVESKWSHLIQMVQTVKFLHSKGVVHRDLKPTNILRNNNGILKIADFGWSEEIKKLKIVRNEWPGTLEINPPEILTATGPTTDRIDNYAIGMAFLLFVSNRFICRQKGLEMSKTASLIMKSIENLRSGKKIPYKFTNETWSIFMGLTHSDPMKRWSLEHVCHHPWVVRNFLYMMEKNSYDGKSLEVILWHEPTRRLLLSYRIPPCVQECYENRITDTENSINESAKPSARLFMRLGRILDWKIPESNKIG